MNTLMEWGIDILQNCFASSMRNDHGAASQLGLNPWNSIDRGLAASQNVCLKTVKVALIPAGQSMEMANHTSWLTGGGNVWNQLYEATLGSLAQVPLLGQGRELNQRVLRAVDALARLYPASLAYQGLLIDIQRRSFEAFLDELIVITDRGEPLTNWVYLQQVWSRVADQVFEEVMGSRAALRTRGQFLNAMNSYKIHQQELMEIYLSLLNLPTRGEIDDIHQTLYQLRKEVKQLRKGLPEEVA